jgi:hypothetical protein
MSMTAAAEYNVDTQKPALGLVRSGATRSPGSVKDLPITRKTLVVRTCFSLDNAWEAVVARLEASAEGWPGTEDYEYVSDPAYDGLTVPELLSLMPPHTGQAYVLVVDAVTLMESDHPVLLVSRDAPAPACSTMADPCPLRKLAAAA